MESASVVVDSAVRAGDEGLTLLGGEPFDQALEAGELSRTAQARGLGVITFTGHRHEALQRIANAELLLRSTDLLVDGPFDATQPEKVRNLVGSANQRFIHLTDRYAGFDPVGHANSVDIRIGSDGTVRIAGFLDSTQLGSIVRKLDVHPRGRTRRSAADHHA